MRERDEEERPSGDSSGVYIGVSASDMGYGELDRVREAPGTASLNAWRWIAVVLASVVLLAFGIWTVS